MLIFTVLSVLILAVVDLVSYTLRRRGWARFGATFLLFYAQIIATEFVLGLFTQLTALPLVALNVAVSGAVVFTVVRKFGKQIIGDYLSGFKSWFRQSSEIRKDDPLYLILLAIALGFAVWIIYLGIIFPALDYDGYSYHLTFTGYVIQNHTFFDPPTSLPWLIGYPKGGEFTQAWSAILLHNDILTDLSQIPFVLLGIYALYQITVTLGASKRHARFAALLFFFLPIVLNQLKTTYVDVMLTAIFFAAVALIIQLRLGKLDLVLLGIAFSLLLAIKSTGLLFLLVLAPLLVWKLYSQRDARSGGMAENYVKPLTLVAAPMLFGLYWYVKNYVTYGTPIYPFGFKVLGIRIFPGKTVQQFADAALSQTALPHGFLAKIWFAWTEQKDWFGCFYNYDTNYAGLGPIWFVILLPSIIIATYFAIKRRNYVFLAVGAAVLALFLIYPDDFYPRYTMFITGIGIAGLGLVLTRVPPAISRTVKILAIVLAVEVIVTNFVLCSYGPKAVNQQVSDLQTGSVRGSEYVQFTGQAYEFLQKKMVAGDVVAYDSKPFYIYPLWKPDFSNRVIYVPADNASNWYTKLKLDGVDYVFTTKKSKEIKWARAKLHRIYRDSMYEIFTVN